MRGLVTGKVQRQLHHADYRRHEHQPEQQSHPDEIRPIAVLEIALAVGAAVYAEKSRQGAFRQLTIVQVCLGFGRRVFWIIQGRYPQAC